MDCHLYSTLCLSVVYLISSLNAEQSQSYTWYSTFADLKNMMEMEKGMISDLANELKLWSFHIELLLAQTELVKNVSVPYSNLGTQMRGEYHNRQNKSWFEHQTSVMQDGFAAITNSSAKKIYNKIKDFPSMDDLNVALKVLLDLQKSSSLKASDLTKGYIMETTTGKSLSLASCMDLAYASCTKSHLYNIDMCQEWIEEARLMMIMEDFDSRDAQAALVQTQVKHQAIMDHHRLCSASINRTYSDNRFNHELKCFLWDNYHHPLLVLQPVRAELLSVNPTIVMFYNVISNRDIEYLRNVSEPILEEAVTFRDRSSRSTKSVDSYRITHNTWIDGPDVLKIDRKAEAITRLQVIVSSEPLQIANYGVGGNYKPHYDAIISEENPAKSVARRATMMYYLTDVRYGGATTFPMLKLAVRPVKGAALYWHNLMWDSGKLDKRTIHAACPVLLGNKWVANKWIHDDERSTCEKHQYSI